MNYSEKELNNHAMEMVIGNLLRAGVMIAAATVLCGGIIYLGRHGAAPMDYRVFRPVPYDLCHVRGILSSAFTFHGRGLIQMGLLLLIATPIARVVLSIFAFARQRDAFYAIVTLFVFAVLIYSLLGK